MDEIKAQLNALLPSLREEFGVGSLWIVGSRARQDNHSESDLDIMVRFDHRGISLLGFCRLERILGEKLDLKVDLVEEGAMRLEVAENISRDAISV